MSPKEIALLLLRTAVAILPELAELVRAALDALKASGAPEVPLAAEIETMLPVMGESARAAVDLESEDDDE